MSAVLLRGAHVLALAGGTAYEIDLETGKVITAIAAPPRAAPAAISALEASHDGAVAYLGARAYYVHHYSNT